MNNGIIYLTYNSECQIRRNFTKMIAGLSCASYMCIIDNASTDNGADVIEEAGYNVIRNGENIGFTAGINLGIKKLIDNGVDGWIFIIHPDVECPQNWDRKLTDFSKNNSECGIIGATLLDSFGKVVHSGGKITKEPALLRKPTMYKIRDGLHVVQKDGLCATRFVSDTGSYKEPRKCYWVTFAAVALNVNMINDIGFLDEKYYLYNSDVNYCMRALQAGWNVWCSDAQFTQYVSSSLENAHKSAQDKARADAIGFVSEEEPKWLLLLDDIHR